MSEHQDRSQLRFILEQVCDGVLELHHIGFTHRTLEPAHVVLNLAPLHVQLISFSNAVPCSQETKYLAKRAPKSVPWLRELVDGATQWDALCIGQLILILEGAIPAPAPVQKFELLRERASKYVEEEHRCENLKLIVKSTILVSSVEEVMTVEMIKEQ